MIRSSRFIRSAFGISSAKPGRAFCSVSIELNGFELIPAANDQMLGFNDLAVLIKLDARPEHDIFIFFFHNHKAGGCLCLGIGGIDLKLRRA